MADLTFDAVVCGGGNKALLLAMYLSKYAGMSVGIFERRHEIGGGLATEELSAPGFRGNTHANIILPWYYAPLWRDFPEFWDYGAQWDQYLCSDGAVFANNNSCLAIYSEKEDPTQERTAREIARFSEKDAEKWLKLWKVQTGDELQRVTMDMLFSPHEWRTAPEYMERQIAVYPLALEAGFEVVLPGGQFGLYVNFGQIWDFLAGIATYDPAGDDGEPGLRTILRRGGR